MNKNKKSFQISFKNNMEDTLLYSWLEEKFSAYGNKSAYVKFILREKMYSELNQTTQAVKSKR
jgi:hypothetical protein